MAMQRSPQREIQRAPITIRTARNRYDLDLSKKPEGMSYEWKAKTIVGMENVEGQVTAEVNGWVPVPAGRHPEVMGMSRSLKNPDGLIERGGHVLMERPIELTRESKVIDQTEAANQVYSQLASLKLTGHRAAGKGIKRSYEQIPDEDEI